jgi:hypothetical protein
MRRQLSISVRTLLIVGAVVALTACAIFTRPGGGGVVLYAQTLPAGLHAIWDRNPAADNVTDYQFTLDGGSPITVPLSVCTATTCTFAFTVPAFGNHAATVAARNLKLSSDPTSFQTGPASQGTFTLNQNPGKPGGTAGAVTFTN